MANFVATNLAKAQAKLINQFQNGELRFREPVLFKKMLEGAQIMFPEYTSLRTSEKRVIEAGYALRTSRVLGGARTHNHTGAKGDTGILTPSWTTYSDEFVSTLKSGDSNTYNNAEQLNIELQNVIANFSEGLESAAASSVFNSRSQVNNAVAEGSFDGVTNTFQITEATAGTRAIQISKSMAYENKYNGGLVAICDTIAYNKFEYQANQGSANSENLSFQFSGMDFLHSVEMNSLAAGLGITKGFWIVVPMGMMAALPWIPVQNRNGYESKENLYTSIQNPIDGLSYASHSYEERIDGTPLNGETQDLKTEFQISLDVAFDYAPVPSSGAGASPLLAAALI